MHRMPPLIVIAALLSLSIPLQAQTGWTPDRMIGFGANVTGPTVNYGWTTGNLGDTWQEGEWAAYQFSIINVNLANTSFSDIVISWNFTHGSLNSRYVDLVRGIQIGRLERLNDQGWPTAAGTAMPHATLADLNLAQNSPGITAGVEHLWQGFYKLNLPQAQINYGPGLATDPSHSIRITRADLLAALPATLVDSASFVIYFNLHLSQSYVWSHGIQSQFNTTPTNGWGGSLYNVPPYNTDVRQGSGFAAPGAGTVIANFGNKSAALPLPASPTGSITGVKWNDLDLDVVQDAGEAAIANWQIVGTGMVSGVPLKWTELTNASGTYTMQQLPNGTYLVSEQAQSVPVPPAAQFPPGGPPSTWLQSYPIANTTVGNAVSVATPAAGLSAGYAAQSWSVNLSTASTQGNVNFGNGIPAPVCGVTPSQQQVCTGAQAVFTASRVSGGTGPLSYVWRDASNTIVSQTATLTLTASAATVGTYNVVITDANGLSSQPVTATLQMYAPPACSITFNSPVCPNATVTLTGPAGMSAYAWSVTGAALNIGALNASTVTFDAGAVCGQQISVSLTVTDANSCVNTCQQTITITDTIPPVITTLAGALDATIQCSDGAALTAAVALAPVASDNCSASVTMHLVSDTLVPDPVCLNGYVQTRTWNFEDICGNVSANFVQTITVIDNTPPVVTTVAGSLDATVECSDAVALAAALTLLPTATDNCAETVTLQAVSDTTIPDATCPNGYVRTRTWNFVDACSNVSANFSQAITVVDTTPPALVTAEGDLDVQLDCDDAAGLTAALAMAPVATDNCSINLVLTLESDVTISDPTCTNASLRIRTWTFNDGCGNISDPFEQWISIDDMTPPVVTTLAGTLDRTLECSDAAGLAAALALVPAATENCVNTPVIHLVQDVTTVDAACANAYIRDRIWVFDDGCGNASAPFAQRITVVDTTPPQITTLAGALDVTIQCSDGAALTAAVALAPVASDNCSASVTMHLVSDTLVPDLVCLNGFVQTRTWNFDDGCGNVSANFVQTISVIDNTPPVVTTLAGSLDATVECSDAVALAAALTLLPTATDNCAETVTLQAVSDTTIPDASCPNGYVRTRTWNFVDACSNVSANFSQAITVVDTTPPALVTAEGDLDVQLDCADAAGLAAALAMAPVATDNCSINLVLTLESDVTISDPTCANASLRIRTWTFNDGCGNISDPFEQWISIDDMTPPVVTTLAGTLDRTLECSDAAGMAAALALVPAATENCTNAPVIHLVQDATTVDAVCANASIRDRIWVFDDGCGNVSAPYAQRITVIDTTPPQITTVAGALDVTLECDDAAGLTAALALEPAATDNCSTVPVLTLVLDTTIMDATCASAYVRTRSWTFNDGCGNVSAAFAQAITVVDTTPPTLVTAEGDLDVQLDCDDTTGYAAALALLPDAIDNCSTNLVMTLTSDVTISDPTCGNSFLRVRIWTFDDGCGNVSDPFEQWISVDDVTPPVVTTIAGSLDRTLECSDAAGLTAALALEPAATENCAALPVIHMVQDATTVDAVCANAYIRDRVWVFDDGCGNVSIPFVQRITVVDTTPPALVTAEGDLDVQLDCDDAAGLAAALAMLPDATDNCSTSLVLTLASDVTISDPTCANASLRIRTWTFNDGCGNISDPFEQWISIDDMTPPVVTTIAGSLDRTLECSDAAGMIAALALEPTATENCVNAPVIHMVQDATTVDAACANASTRDRIWVFDDGCGNVSLPFTQRITVIDTTPPQITTLAGALDVTLECDNAAGLTAALALQPAALDNCTGTVTMHVVTDTTVPDPSCPNGYVRTRTWNFDDGCSNLSSNFAQTITVRDVTPPAFTTLAGALDVTLGCDNAAGLAAALLSLPSATDNCDAAPALHLVLDTTIWNENCSNAYVRARTWNSVDACGNISSNFTQTIAVVDNTNPILTAGTINSCYADALTAEADALAATAASDNCTTEVQLSVSTTGTCAAVITVTGSDGCGNTSSVTYNTRIDDTVPYFTYIPPSDTIECSGALTFGSPVAVDACGSAVVVAAGDPVRISGGCPSQYSMTQSWYAIDACGNTSAAISQTITVIDTTPPLLQSMQTISAGCSTTNAWSLPVASLDACNGALLTVSSDIVILANVPSAGQITQRRIWVMSDECGNQSQTSQDIISSMSCEHFTLAHTAYGNPNGTWCGVGHPNRLQLIQSLLTTPLVIGQGARTLTITQANAACVIQTLPASGVPTTMPAGNHVFNTSCVPGTIPINNNGRFTNVMMGNVIALGLNLRLDPTLGPMVFLPPPSTPWLLTQDADDVNGICGDGNDIPSGPNHNEYIPPSVLAFMGSTGSNKTVQDLFLLAINALAGGSIPGVSLSDISDAVAAINKAFENGRFFVGYRTSLTPKASEEPMAAEGFILAANHPNPFNPSTTIEFTVPEQAQVHVTVYNELGAQVAELFNGTKDRGTYAIHWTALGADGAVLPSGMYIAELRCETPAGRMIQLTRQMVLVK